MHLGELFFYDQQDRGLVVKVTGKVHVDGMRDDVGVLGRVGTSEVLVLDEDWAVCLRQRSEGERTTYACLGGTRDGRGIWIPSRGCCCGRLPWIRRFCRVCGR